MAGNTTEPGEIRMPAVLHFQTWSRDPRNPVVMNYAWSTVGYPTLFISQSYNHSNCTNKTLQMLNSTAFIDSQSFGSVYVSGSGSGGSSVAMVFRRLIVFDGGKKAKAENGFNSSEAAGNSSQYHSVYLSDDTIDWWYNPAHKSIIGRGRHLFGTVTFNVSLTFKKLFYFCFLVVVFLTV